MQYNCNLRGISLLKCLGSLFDCLVGDYLEKVNLVGSSDFLKSSEYLVISGNQPLVVQFLIASR